MIDPTSPAQLERARRVLAHEGAAGGATARDRTAAVRVYEKIHVQLASLMGVGGATLLFARSAKLTQGEFARFADLSVDEGATKLRAHLEARDPAVATESAAALFGNLFTLVTTFIGERLLAQVLRNAWPTLADTAPREKNK